MEENQTVKSRLKSYIDAIGLSDKAFEKSISAQNGYVNSIKKGIGGKYLEMIKSKYQDLNIKWLLYGEGDMFTKDTYVLHDDPVMYEKERNEVIPVQLSYILEKDRVIKELYEDISEYKADIKLKEKELENKTEIINRLELRIKDLEKIEKNDKQRITELTDVIMGFSESATITKEEQKAG